MMTGSDQLELLSGNTSLHTLEFTIQKRQQLEGQCRSAGTITMPGLTEQISQVEQLMANVMCVNMVGSQENIPNDNVNTNTNFDLETLDLEVTWSIIQVSQG